MDENLIFKQNKFAFHDPIRVGENEFTVQQIVRVLEPMLTDERRTRLQQVAANRSCHVAAVLENIYDRGNISAVMRSFEAFGFLRLHLVDAPGAKFKAAGRVTRGAEKWLDIRTDSRPEDTVKALKEDGYQILATDLDTDRSIFDIDWSCPTAIVLGNEKEGVSREMCDLVDGRFRIPMLGFSQSFNISVAGALIFYHAHLALEKLPGRARINDDHLRVLLANYYLRCFDNPEKLLML